MAQDGASVWRRPRWGYVPVVVATLLLLLGTAVAAQGSSWSQVGDDILGGHDESAFARSIDISADGTRILVGEPHFHTDHDFAGRIRVFDFIDGSWVQTGHDLTGDAPYDKLGTSVSISADGTHIAAGAVQHGPIDKSGFARVFELIDGTWTQIGEDLLGENVEDEAGESVSLNADGSIVAIGAPSNTGALAALGGHVRVFGLFNNAWVQMGGDIDGHGSLGTSVALDATGYRLVTGSPGYSGLGPRRGYVRVLDFVDAAWTDVGLVNGEDDGDRLGGIVDISADGSTIVAGSTFNDGAGERAGHVQVLQEFAFGWTQLGSDIDAASDNEWFGWDVSIAEDGRRVAVALRITTRNDSGHVRVYDLGETGWFQVGDDVSNNSAGDDLGEAVALSADGSRLAVGSSDGRDNGHARVFELAKLDPESNDPDPNEPGPDEPVVTEPVDPDPPVVMCGGEEATIVGTSGNDVLYGTAGPDVISALQGDDRVLGLGGDDIICGGVGDDELRGGGGFDIIYGAQGNDSIYSSDGASAALREDIRGMRAFGGAGDDVIYGSDRWDRMQGGPGADQLFGFEGQDWMRGGPGNDNVDGGAGVDDLHGGNGSDTLLVTNRDTVRGGAGPNDACEISGTPARVISCERRR